MANILYDVLTPGDVKILAGCGGKTANGWVLKYGDVRRTAGGTGPVLVTTDSILPVINNFRIKKGKVALRKFEVEKELRKNNE